MKITVRAFANMRDLFGSSEITLQLRQGSTLDDLFTHLSGLYGNGFDRLVRDQLTGNLVPFIILINGTGYRSSTDMHTSLKDDDVVTIMIPFDGG